MTRILALGDTQLGVQTVTLESQAQVLDRIADVAIDQQADLVLHGGDVFEGPEITPEQLAVFRQFVARLREADIPLIALTGNSRHDQAMRAVHGLAIFEDIPGITVSSRPTIITEAKAHIVTLPWASPARLVAESNGRFERDRVNEYAAEVLVRIAADLANTPWNKGPKILLAHWTISGSSLPTGLPVDHLREPVIEWADLDALGFDCVIASHIHKPQRLDDPALGDATMGIYTGSPQPLNHGEAGFAHGVWLVDVESGACSFDFIEIESPQFVTLDISLDPEDDEVVSVDAVNRKTTALGMWTVAENAIIRVRYTATREQDAKIDKDAIRRELLAAGASRVTIEPQITREVRARVETLTQDLGPIEAMLLYCKAQNIEPLTAERMGERLKTWIG